MDRDEGLFTIEELSEIQSLKILGGNGISPLAQMDCSDDDCTIVHNKCTHRGCVVERDCPGHVDNRCGNTGCYIHTPDSDCLCADLTCISHILC